MAASDRGHEAAIGGADAIERQATAGLLKKKREALDIAAPAAQDTAKPGQEPGVKSLFAVKTG